MFRAAIAFTADVSGKRGRGEPAESTNGRSGGSVCSALVLEWLAARETPVSRRLSISKRGATPHNTPTSLAISCSPCGTNIRPRSAKQ